jgi:Domain of unknown function (DUF4185)/Beta xylosidase C-terminal Concanavalin A-like domain
MGRRLAFFIAAIALLSVGFAASGCVFEDNFDPGDLNAAWEWQNPGLTASYSLSNGAFNLNVGKSNDQSMGVDRAPRILKQQNGATWTIETKIASSSGNASTFAGLTVYLDSQNWLLWGWFGNSSLQASGLIGNSYTQPFGVMDSKYPYLRIRKSGSAYYFDASADGVNWTNANVYRDSAGSLVGARVGLLGRDWNAGSGLSYSVAFDYFRDSGSDLMPSLLSEVGPPVRVAQETGAASINPTDRVDVCGADLGISFEWQDRTYFAFGDTRSCIKPTLRRSNVLAFSSDPDPSDGIKFDGWITDSVGAAKEMFREDIAGVTAIPTGGVGVGPNAYLFYMSVTSWDSPPGAWTCNQTSIASARATSPGTWTKNFQTIHWAPGNFNQLAVAKEGSTLYIWGIPCGRFGSVKLMKVQDTDILRQDAYQYFAGYDPSSQPVWSANEAQAVTVAGGPAGELSVRFNTHLGRFVMTYLDQRKSAIVMRESPRPWGPWSAPVPIVTDPPYSQIYGAFMPETTNDQSFYYMMSQFGPYNTFLMQTTLP